MRNIADVLGKIISIVPVEESALKYELHSLMQSIAYAAPEMNAAHWTVFQRIINDYLPPQEQCSDWQLQIANIFTGKE